jgi:predicted NAD/FAD-binding protein
MELQRMLPGAGKNKVEVKHANGVDVFDRVVMATHSDTARKLRGSDISSAEAAVLNDIPYSTSKVYLHTGNFIPIVAYTHEQQCCARTKCLILCM